MIQNHMPGSPRFNPNKHHRRSIRLKGYDYSKEGLFFVTICIKNRHCLFGKIINHKMILDDAGIMIEKWYAKIETKFPDIKCHEHITMPNHFHCIIENVGVVGAHPCVRPVNDVWAHPRLRPDDGGGHMGPPLRVFGEHAGSPLSTVLQWFKTMSTNEYIRNVKNNAWPPFEGKLWQRNYWEHIIRDEISLFNIAEYINNNPLNWNDDFFHP